MRPSKGVRIDSAWGVECLQPSSAALFFVRRVRSYFHTPNALNGRGEQKSVSLQEHRKDLRKHRLGERRSTCLYNALLKHTAPMPFGNELTSVECTPTRLTSHAGGGCR